MDGYIDRILSYCKGITYEAFCSNTMLVEACIFNLGQLGELAGKVDPSYQKSAPQIPWRQMSGLRNRIVHDYEGVNLKLIWEVISEDLPALHELLATIV